MPEQTPSDTGTLPGDVPTDDAAGRRIRQLEADCAELRRLRDEAQVLLLRSEQRVAALNAAPGPPRIKSEEPGPEAAFRQAMLERRVLVLEDRLAAMLNSHSWRVTVPARAIGLWLRRWFRR